MSITGSDTQYKNNIQRNKAKRRKNKIKLKQKKNEQKKLEKQANETIKLRDNRVFIPINELNTEEKKQEYLDLIHASQLFSPNREEPVNKKCEKQDLLLLLLKFAQEFLDTLEIKSFETLTKLLNVVPKVPTQASKDEREAYVDFFTSLDAWINIKLPQLTETMPMKTGELILEKLADLSKVFAESEFINEKLEEITSMLKGTLENSISGASTFTLAKLIGTISNIDHISHPDPEFIDLIIENISKTSHQANQKEKFMILGNLKKLQTLFPNLINNEQAYKISGLNFNKTLKENILLLAIFSKLKDPSPAIESQKDELAKSIASELTNSPENRRAICDLFHIIFAELKNARNANKKIPNYLNTLAQTLKDQDVLEEFIKQISKIKPNNNDVKHQVTAKEILKTISMCNFYLKNLFESKSSLNELFASPSITNLASNVADYISRHDLTSHGENKLHKAMLKIQEIREQFNISSTSETELKDFGGFAPDFILTDKKTGKQFNIEFDGKGHKQNSVITDSDRDEYFTEELGIEVIRYRPDENYYSLEDRDLEANVKDKLLPRLTSTDNF